MKKRLYEINQLSATAYNKALALLRQELDNEPYQPIKDRYKGYKTDNRTVELYSYNTNTLFDKNGNFFGFIGDENIVRQGLSFYYYDGNENYQQIANAFIELCEEKGELFTDVILYILLREYPIAVVDENNGDIEEQKKLIAEEYETLWAMQPTLEENAEQALAIQHARDFYDVLLGR